MKEGEEGEGIWRRWSKERNKWKEGKERQGRKEREKGNEEEDGEE